MLLRDLLEMVFNEFEDGHDMLNFREINRKCHQIFHQNLEICHEGQSSYTQKKQTKQQHGLFRCINWLDRLQTLLNYVNGEYHGIQRQYSTTGHIYLEGSYHHGIRHGPASKWWWCSDHIMVKTTYYNNKLHGLYESWEYNGDERKTIMYSHGIPIENKNA